jgi:hypothetical protein
VVRDGKNLKGRLLGLLLGIAGKRVLAKTTTAIEACLDADRPIR